MKKTIYLIRHGECVSNHQNIFIGRSLDPPLTDKGIQQAQSLARHLQGMEVSAVVSSSLLRAKQTAQIISEAVNIPCQSTDKLLEVDLGALDRKDIGNKGFLSMYTQMVQNWEDGYEQVGILDGESLLEVNDRLLPFFTRTLKKHESEAPILLIGHAILWMGFIWKNCVNQPQKIKDGFMEVATFSIIEVGEEGFIARDLNVNPRLLSRKYEL